MIDRAALTKIGRIAKTHGLAGEVSAYIEADIDFDAGDCLVLDIDGIPVPFFIASARRRGADAWLLTIDGITSQPEASEIVGCDIFVTKDRLGDDDIVYISDMEGFTLFNAADGTSVGRITAIDDSTENILFTIETPDGREFFIPFAEELVTGIDPDAETVTMSIADGLLEL